MLNVCSNAQCMFQCSNECVTDCMDDKEGHLGKGLQLLEPSCQSEDGRALVPGPLAAALVSSDRAGDSRRPTGAAGPLSPPVDPSMYPHSQTVRQLLAPLGTMKESQRAVSRRPAARPPQPLYLCPLHTVSTASALRR